MRLNGRLAPNKGTMAGTSTANKIGGNFELDQAVIDGTVPDFSNIPKFK